MSWSTGDMPHTHKPPFPTSEVGVIAAPSSSLCAGCFEERDQQRWLRATGILKPSQCPTTPVLRDVRPGHRVTAPGIPQRHWQGAACPQAVLRAGKEMVVVVVAAAGGDGRKAVSLTRCEWVSVTPRTAWRRPEMQLPWCWHEPNVCGLWVPLYFWLEELSQCDGWQCWSNLQRSLQLLQDAATA